MKHVIFVDDEPLVLKGLARLLHPLRTEWQMTFVTSGAQALEAMTATPFDVLVTDMRMPGVSGSALLAEVSNRYPDTIRIVLSGMCDREEALSTVAGAHQFLAKPCDADLLRKAVERAFTVKNYLAPKPAFAVQQPDRGGPRSYGIRSEDRQYSCTRHSNDLQGPAACQFTSFCNSAHCHEPDRRLCLPWNGHDSNTCLVDRRVLAIPNKRALSRGGTSGAQHANRESRQTNCQIRAVVKGRGRRVLSRRHAARCRETRDGGQLPGRVRSLHHDSRGRWAPSAWHRIGGVRSQSCRCRHVPVTAVEPTGNRDGSYRPPPFSGTITWPDLGSLGDCARSEYPLQRSAGAGRIRPRFGIPRRGQCIVRSPRMAKPCPRRGRPGSTVIEGPFRRRRTGRSRGIPAPAASIRSRNSGGNRKPVSKRWRPKGRSRIVVPDLRMPAMDGFNSSLV